MPFKVPLIGIFLTDEEAPGSKTKVRYPSHKLREPFMEKVGLFGIKCESDTSTPKTALGKIAFIENLCYLPDFLGEAFKITDTSHLNILI